MGGISYQNNCWPFGPKEEMGPITNGEIINKDILIKYPKNRDLIVQDLESICTKRNIYPLEVPDGIIGPKSIVRGGSYPYNSTVIIAVRYGDGSVLALGSSGPLIDDALNEYSNKKFASNIFKWFSPNPKRVYFSLSYQPDVDFNSDFTKLKELLSNEYQVSRIEELTPNSIKKIENNSVLVIFEPNIHFDNEVVETIKDYVDNGGHLLLMGIGNYGDVLEVRLEEIPINQIAKIFGIRFNKFKIVDKNHNLENKENQVKFRTTIIWTSLPLVIHLA